MNIVLDTNILYVSISSRSPYHWIFQALLNQKFNLCVTTDILNEYQEIFECFLGTATAEYTMRLLDELPNVKLVTKYFQWNLIVADYDDNKFADCAIASNADFIATNDKHFSILKTIDFPKVKVVNLEQFQKIAQQNGWV